ncbi:hypothetical protein MTBBW1_1210009 [Desulfamplus magnetovallimortis]|uniref:Uncharacterized protein n=1 Tax=Desulfamplus magnetovallimortis TaxID=1246637 RepID=A0A1W1H667_9BACT|nr:hypothetical protein MTBBW1_1210009 [Desulfamplus magnetovallimortis]
MVLSTQSFSCSSVSLVMELVLPFVSVTIIIWSSSFDSSIKFLTPSMVNLSVAIFIGLLCIFHVDLKVIDILLNEISENREGQSGKR